MTTDSQNSGYQANNEGKKKAYEKPSCQEITREQAVLKIGAANMGDEGMKEFLEIILQGQRGEKNVTR